MVEGMTELEKQAKELQDAHAKASQRQAKLNASSDYWQASAFKNAEMKSINSVYNADAEIKAQDERVKKERAKAVELRKDNCPLEFTKAQKLSAGFKLLCQAIIEPTAKHELEGVNIKDCASYKEAYFKAVQAYRAKIVPEMKAKAVA